MGARGSEQLLNGHDRDWRIHFVSPANWHSASGTNPLGQRNSRSVSGLAAVQGSLSKKR
jgi:hypothetical protein